MSEVSSIRHDSFMGSSRVSSDGPDSNINGEEQISHRKCMRDGGGGDEFDPVDAWLPVTESRNGSTLTATFQLLCSGIGIQLLQLPIALVSLGWIWGILWLSIAFSWQLYTTWLLVNLHESSPVTGIRYSRFIQLSILAFGEKLGKLLAIFPTMYLSGGTCVLYIIMGGAVMKIFFKSMCGGDLDCWGSTVTGAECFLAFICIAILAAQFFPNLNSLSSAALVGSITALVYCSLLWILPLSKGRANDDDTKILLLTGNPTGISDAFIGCEFLAFAFRGHNLVLEIQGTLPTSPNQPSRKSMWRGVMISYLLIAMCLYPMTIVGYWAYGNKMPIDDGGMLGALTLFHGKSVSRHVVSALCVMIIINYVCAFQIYAMPTFDNLERIYTSKKNKACPRWVRSAIKVFVGGVTYFVAVSFPFLPRLAAFTGALALPVTLVYPCLMWLTINKPRRLGPMWCLNLGLASSGALLTLVFLPAALWSLISNGLNANFYSP